MAIESKIQWTDATWNPWHGCKKVSPGCKFCYMYRDKDRYGLDPTVVARSKTKFREPLSWKEPRLVFTCSWSDFFIDEADAWRAEAWEVIRATPQHTYQILTKRPERILEHLPPDWGDGYNNVWIGVSIESRAQAGPRLWHLAQVPAKVRFVSVEPLLGWVDLGLDAYLAGPDGLVDWSTARRISDLIQWVIVGGESGNESGQWRYRPCEIRWIEYIVSQCQQAGVPVFVKQLGTHLAKRLQLSHRHGGDMGEWPAHLQVREMPSA